MREIHSTVQVDVLPDGAENVHYDEAGIPVYLQHGLLSMYPDYSASAHWHNDTELLLIQSGEMEYSIDGAQVLLRPGDIIAVNSCHIHCGYSKARRECAMLCLLFDPQWLLKDGLLQKEYILPVTESPLAYHVFRAGTPQADRVSGIMQEMFRRKGVPDSLYHMFTLQSLLGLWELIYAAFHAQAEMIVPDPGLEQQRKMLALIDSRFMENLTLDDIAREGCVSKSTCCRIFRKYTGQSPVGYLNRHRLEKAAELLRATSCPVTRIATGCGFTAMSYFSKCFLGFYHMTPSEYRRGVKSE